MHEEPLLPRPDQDISLHQVIKDFGERVCPSGSYGEINEWDLYDESFRRLVNWAEEKGRFFEGFQPLVEGGREHDLVFDPLSSSWLKFTKPSAAGYVISFDTGKSSLENALPLEYLERLALQNEIFADNVNFIGIGDSKTQNRIITRQADIPGTSARNQEIIALMVEELGFTQLPPKFSVGYTDSLAFIREDVAVFDLRPANVVKTESGIIVPIDSIPCRLNDRALSILSSQ